MTGVDESLWARCYLAWEMRHKKHSIGEIHRVTHLYPSLKGYSYFFRNRIYTGDYEHGGVIYEKFVPALIPREWYEEEQAKRQERRKKTKGEEVPPELEPRRIASLNLLSGKLDCESVPGEQHPMHAHRSKATKSRTAWNAYECSVHKHKGKESCPCYGVSQAAMDKSVIDTLLRDVITRENLRPLVAQLNTHLASRQSTLTIELSNLDTQIAEAERQRKKHVKLIAADDNPSTSLVDELKGYEREKALLLEQKRQLEASGPTALDVDTITDAKLDEYIERVRAVLLGDDVLLARRIIDHIVHRVVFKHGSTTGTLYYTFPSDFFVPNLSPLRMRSLEGFRVRADYRFGFSRLPAGFNVKFVERVPLLHSSLSVNVVVS